MENNNVEKYLKSIEDMQNGPPEGEEMFLGNRRYYIEWLLKQNFIPTEDAIQLYKVYSSGKQDSWWCRSSLSFRDFCNAMKAAESREAKYKKDYRRGFSDGIRFILDALVD